MNHKGRPTHGLSHIKAYKHWKWMRTRCNNPNTDRAHRYYERGIICCDSWDDFENFYRDMGDPPIGMTLERLNNDEGYCKENCKWATKGEQARNRENSSNIFAGVYFMKARQKWLAQTNKIEGYIETLYYGPDFCQAVLARVIWEFNHSI